MPFEIYLTTAEEIVGATDATLQKHTGIDVNTVAQFLDIPASPNANNAIRMAEQLGLVSLNHASEYVPSFPYAVYLVTSELQHKAAIIRLVLEQFAPYKTFKTRLKISGLAPEAANQTRAIHNIVAHRNEILSTFISLGTYTNSLVSEGAGLYKVSENATVDYLSIISEIVQNRESAEQYVRRRVGVEAAEWIDQQEVLYHLVTGYQRAAFAGDDSRAPIVHAGNAIESFLVQVANHFAVNVQSAHGINAKADRLEQANHLTTKHKFMVKYLGHLRNAADHGIDQEINQAWDISQNTAIEYIYIAQSVIADIVAYINNRFVV
jgi:hypothetical protein